MASSEVEGRWYFWYDSSPRVTGIRTKEYQTYHRPRLADVPPLERQGLFRGLVAHCVLAAACLGVLYYVAYRRPLFFVFLAGEDSWVEYVTFLAWACAALLTTRRAPHSKTISLGGLCVFARE